MRNTQLGKIGIIRRELIGKACGGCGGRRVGPRVRQRGAVVPQARGGGVSEAGRQEKGGHGEEQQCGSTRGPSLGGVGAHPPSVSGFQTSSLIRGGMRASGRVVALASHQSLQRCCAQLMNATALPCSIATAFGRPVEPEV